MQSVQGSRRGSEMGSVAGRSQVSAQDFMDASGNVMSAGSFKARQQQSKDAEALARLTKAMEGRTGKGFHSGMFRKGLEGWVKDSLSLQQQRKDVESKAQEYVPITVEDLKATGTRDWESARRVVHKSKDDTLAGGKKIIPYLDYTVKELTHTPLELTTKPPVLCLHLGYNHLHSMHFKFYLMPMLCELNMDQNELKEIPSEFGSLTTLKILSLRNNKIESISQRFCNLTNLEELSLAYNQLKKLPDFWGQMCKLKNLCVSGNQLECLPESEYITMLEYDPETGKRLRKFSPGVGGLTSLEQLWVDCNQIPHIPEEIRQCQRLRYMNFRRNKVSEIPNVLGELSDLEYLVVTHNTISQIPLSLCRLAKLHTLEMENNRVTEIPEHMIESTSLTELNLANNPILNVPSAVSLMENLINFRTTNAGKNGKGVFMTGNWNRTHSQSNSFAKIVYEFDRPNQPYKVSLDRSNTRPGTSCARLYPLHPESNPEGPNGRPSTKSGRRLAPIEWWDGRIDQRPMTWMTPGGEMPSKRASTYSAPPSSIRAPGTPFSNSRPNTRGWSSGGFM